MILDVLLLVGGGARAEEAPPSSGEERGDGDVLAPHREAFPLLVERSIGLVSRPVLFDWRRSPAQLGLQGALPFELNSFHSLRGGLHLRLPSEAVLVELDLAWVEVWDSPNSEQLALTPYRQNGRPSRLELDALVALPLAEGIVTPRFALLPPAQLVLSGLLGLRYELFPTGFQGLKPGQIGRALIAPQLTEEELDNLEWERLDAMSVDPARYALVAGLGNDLYLRSGLYISPRLICSLPLLASLTETELLWWAELSLGLGYSF